jgi:hypothetical protein
VNKLASLIAFMPIFGLSMPGVAFTADSYFNRPIPPDVRESDAPTPLDAEDQRAGQIVTLYAADIMKIPGVWGVEDHLEPDGHIAIRVDVERITPQIETAIPQTLGEFPVEIFAAPMPVEDIVGEQPRSCRAPRNVQAKPATAVRRDAPAPGPAR